MNDEAQRRAGQQPSDRTGDGTRERTGDGTADRSADEATVQAEDGPAGRGVGLSPGGVTAAAGRVLRSDAIAWFEPLYAAADGDASAVPWAASAPHPHVVGWLDQPGLDVTDVDAVVVGAGLGDDAAELAGRGCRVTAFDVSPSAVDWARRRFEDVSFRHPISWEVADLLDLPDHYRGAFGLVVEVRTVQSLPGSLRDEAMLGVASLVGVGGWLLATTLLATSDAAATGWQGPPWAQAPAELAAYRAGGLERVALDHPPVDGAAPPAAMDVRLTFRRPESSRPATTDPEQAGRDPARTDTR